MVRNNVRFHFRVQFKGSRGSEEGVGINVFCAELSWTISVPGMSSTLLWSVAILKLLYSSQIVYLDVEQSSMNLQRGCHLIVL